MMRFIPALLAIATLNVYGENIDTDGEKVSPSADEYSNSISKTDISPEVLELLNTESLPGLTPELAVEFLLNYAPQKPEWIYAKKYLQEQMKSAQAKSVKEYKHKIDTTVVPYGKQIANEVISLEPFKFSTISFIDASGSPWPVSAVKASNNTFNILGDSEIPPEAKASNNHIVIRGQKDYSDGNVLVYLKDYQFPVILQVETGSEIVDPVRTVKIMSSIPKGTKTRSHKTTPLYSSPELREFLVTPPANSEIVAVKGEGVDVYKLNGAYYVVTRYQINVPYQEVEYGDGDVRVYKVSKDSMLDRLTFTHKGELISFDVMLQGASHG